MRFETKKFAWLLTLLVPTAGCAVGVPPVTLQAAMGTRNVGDTPAAAATSLRAGIAPLALVPSLEDRRFDVVAGYQRDSGPAADSARAAETMHNATFALGWYPVVDHRDTGGFSRVGLFTQGRMIWDGSTGTQGWGTALQLTGELGSFVRDGSKKRSIAEDGQAMPCPREGKWGVIGEASLGLFAEAGYARLGPYDIWTGVVGLSIRLPAVGYVNDDLRSRRYCCCTASTKW